MKITMQDLKVASQGLRFYCTARRRACKKEIVDRGCLRCDRHIITGFLSDTGFPPEDGE